MQNKIVALKIWDISWPKRTEEKISAVVIVFAGGEEHTEDFIDRNCRNFNRWSVNDEAVDKYFRKQYGETPEEFCAEFCFDGEEVERKEVFYGH